MKKLFTVLIMAVLFVFSANCLAQNHNLPPVQPGFFSRISGSGSSDLMYEHLLTSNIKVTKIGKFDSSTVFGKKLSDKLLNNSKHLIKARLTMDIKGGVAVADGASHGSILVGTLPVSIMKTNFNTSNNGDSPNPLNLLSILDKNSYPYPKYIVYVTHVSSVGSATSDRSTVVLDVVASKSILQNSWRGNVWLLAASARNSAQATIGDYPKARGFFFGRFGEQGKFTTLLKIESSDLINVLPVGKVTAVSDGVVCNYNDVKSCPPGWLKVRLNGTINGGVGINRTQDDEYKTSLLKLQDISALLENTRKSASPVFFSFNRLSDAGLTTVVLQMRVLSFNKGSDGTFIAKVALALSPQGAERVGFDGTGVGATATFHSNYFLFISGRPKQ